MNKDKRYRDKINSKGLYEVRGIWAPKDKHQEIKEEAEQIINPKPLDPILSETTKIPIF